MFYRVIFVLCYVSFFYTAVSQNNLSTKNCKISGVIREIGNRKVKLGNKALGHSSAFKEVFYDSCLSKNDSFYFDTKLEYPEIYSIEVDECDGWISFILGEDNVNINGHKDSIYKAKIIAGIEQNTFTLYNDKFYKPLLLLHHRYYDIADSLKKNGDTTLYKNYLDSSQRYYQLSIETIFDFSKSHPNRFVSLLMIDKNFAHLNFDSVSLYYSHLSEELKNSSRGKKLKDKIFGFQNIKVNAPIPDFKLIDSSSRSVNFSSYRGRYILIDFWASWCGPCISEFPGIRLLRKKYNSNVFEVIGISLDVDKTEYVKSLGKYSVTWPTYSDFLGDQSLIYTLFNITSIPYKLLIDPEGKLVLINPTIKQIDQFLQKMLSFPIVKN